MEKIYKKGRNKAKKAAYGVILGISWEGGGGYDFEGEGYGFLTDT
jgi:hypothetical protein